MKKTKITQIAILLIAALLTFSCSSDDIEEQKIKNKSIIKVEKMPSTRSKNKENNLYSITYKHISLDNVTLSEDDLHKLRMAIGIDTVSVNIKGFSTYERRPSRNKEWYKFAFNPKNPLTKQCGIPPGIYIVQDVYFIQTYTLPSSLVVMLEYNDYTGFSKMGWDPVTLKGPKYTWSLSGNVVTLKTAGILIKYLISGQEVFLTYPVRASDIEWRLKYLLIKR